ncbi:MAG TPA: nitrogenase component 1 [Methanosarcina sp.]|jgi:nitrogenase molybdenum-iron protein alpha chain
MLKSKSEFLVPTREERLGTVCAYGGSGKDLARCARGGCLKNKNRSFSQSSACDEMMPLLNAAMINDNVVIAHSPVGCSSMIPGVTLLYKMEREMRELPSDTIKAISTNFGENEVVYGGASELESAILEAENRYHPKLITIISSCAAGIIGDDLQAVVNKVQPKIKGIIIPMQCEGFRSGSVATGYDTFLVALMRAIEPPKKKKKDTLLIVNPLTISHVNELEIERLLAKVGIKVQYFPLFTDVANLKNVSEATGASTLCNLMSNLFLINMEKKYGIPYVEPPMPVGIEFTNWWLRDTAKLFGKEKEIEEVIKEEEARVTPLLNEIRSKLEGKRAFVGFNLARTLALQSLLDEFGMETAVSTGLEYSDAYGLAPLENLNRRSKKEFTLQIGNFQHFEWVNLLAKEKPDVLVGGIEYCSTGVRQGIPVAPVLPGTLYVGYEGALSFGKELVRSLRNPSYAKKISARVNLPYRENWYSQSPFKYIGDNQ